MECDGLYGDWGIQNIGSEYFHGVNEILYDVANQTDDMDDEELDVHFKRLWDIMIDAFATMNDSPVFTNNERENVTLLLCGDIPDDFIDEFVKKVNPKEVAQNYVDWDPDA